ncbi:hypothetical protein C7401_13869 [Paraburkholderia unamae]|nr:hypothetical protein C7401_13869 [Paraburkholderia unamae]
MGNASGHLLWVLKVVTWTDEAGFGIELNDML